MTRSCSHSNILVDTIVKNVLHVRTTNAWIINFPNFEALTHWKATMTFGGAVTATYMHAICIWHVRSKLQCIYLQKAMNQNSYINEAATAITNSFDILQIKQIVYWYQECTKKWLTASKVLSTLRPVTRIKRIPAAKHAKSKQRFGLFSKPVPHKNCDKLHLLHTSRACCIQSEPVACHFLPKPVMPDSRK